MRTTSVCAAVVALVGLAAVAIGGGAGGPQNTAMGINTDFTLDFADAVLAARAVPEDSVIAPYLITRVGLERPAVVFAVADDKADAGFDIVFQSTTGREVENGNNVGPLTVSNRGATNCEFLLGISTFDLVGDVRFSDDGGIVAAEVMAKAAHCKGGNPTQGVAVWTVVADKDGGGAVNGIFLRDMETLESVMTLRSDLRSPGKGAALVLGKTAGGASVSYVIERRPDAVR